MTSSDDADIPDNANEHCPGTQSDKAGKSSACDGCPNQQICATAPKTVDPAIAQINERMQSVRHKLLILSGKGGVGKSTVTSQLSFALASDPQCQVGVLDIDVCGPSIPRMLGLTTEKVHQSSYGWSPVYVEENLAVMSIGFMLPSEDEAVIWRGPKKNGMIKQFLRDVDWSELDYLLVDTPPGTSDEHLSIVQYLKESGIDGAVLVTTPQEVSLQDVRKEITFCRKVGIKILGIVENMSGFVCPCCSTESVIFPNSTGGAKAMCARMNVPFLGSLPLDPRVGQVCDGGKSFVQQYPDSTVAKAYMELAAGIKQSLDGN